MNKKVIVLSILIILLGLGGIFVCNKLSNKKSLNEIDISVDIDNGDEDIDWDNFDNHNIKLEKSITIDSEGKITKVFLDTTYTYENECSKTNSVPGFLEVLCHSQCPFGALCRADNG